MVLLYTHPATIFTIAIVFSILQPASCLCKPESLFEYRIRVYKKDLESDDSEADEDMRGYAQQHN